MMALPSDHGATDLQISSSLTFSLPLLPCLVSPKKKKKKGLCYFIQSLSLLILLTLSIYTWLHVDNVGKRAVVKVCNKKFKAISPPPRSP